MGSTANKQREGEAGVRDYLNLWFPYVKEGLHGVKRVPSKGQNDTGDLDGVPYTTIEVKNHKNPVLGSLLKNAEWKAANSQHPIWFLTYKRAGFSVRSAWGWNVCTTVEGFLRGIVPMLPGTDTPAFGVEDVERLCFSEEDLEVEVGQTLPMITPPEHRWGIFIKFRDFYHNMDHWRNRCFEDRNVVWEGDTRSVTFVVNPRVGEPPEKWFVYSRLESMARVLETIGVLPQDISEYVDTPDDSTEGKEKPDPEEAMENLRDLRMGQIHSGLRTAVSLLEGKDNDEIEPLPDISAASAMDSLKEVHRQVSEALDLLEGLGAADQAD